MALVKINERTLVQKLKRFILGSEKPNFLIRMSVVIGFFIWLYFLVWQILIFLSIVLVNRLQDPDMVLSTFNRIGNKYAFMHRWGLDTISTLLVHSIAEIALFLISLLGLIFIYRQKKSGHLLYVLFNGLSIVFTILFLGLDYFKEQISLIDKIIFGSITLYFFIVMFIFKKNN